MATLLLPSLFLAAACDLCRNMRHELPEAVAARSPHELLAQLKQLVRAEQRLQREICRRHDSHGGMKLS